MTPLLLFLNLFIYSPICILFSPLVCLPTLASSKPCQKVQRERGKGRMKGSVLGREEQVPGCFVGSTVKRSTARGTQHPFSRAHFKAGFALVLSTFGRGARVEDLLSSVGS